MKLQISMKTILPALLLAMPLLAQAQAYKCRQPNGSIGFQDQPCAAGATGSTMALPPAGSQPVENQVARPKNAAAKSNFNQRDPRQAEERDAQRARADQQIDEENQKVRAYNQMQRCNFARRQLEVAKAERPVFRRDNNGDRQYVNDENRPAEIAAAGQRVAAECK
jgi:hypothetical protein